MRKEIPAIRFIVYRLQFRESYMEVEFYRGRENSSEYYQQNVRSSTERDNGRGGSDRSDGRPESWNFYYGSKQSENLMNGNINGKHGKVSKGYCMLTLIRQFY